MPVYRFNQNDMNKIDGEGHSGKSRDPFLKPFQKVGFPTNQLKKENGTEKHSHAFIADQKIIGTGKGKELISAQRGAANGAHRNQTPVGQVFQQTFT